MLKRYCYGIVSAKGYSARQHLVYHYGAGVYVAFGSNVISASLLGGNIVNRAYNVGARKGTGGGRRISGYAEVRKLYGAAGYHNVLRLYVPVDYAVFMGMVQCVQYLTRNVYRFLWRNASANLDILLESHTLNVFKHNVAYAVFVCSCVVRLYNIWMGQ